MGKRGSRNWKKKISGMRWKHKKKRRQEKMRQRRRRKGE